LSNIGFIGLGIMGRPMTKNLIKAGHKLVVHDVVKASIDDVVGAGATQGASSADVASKSEIIITMLPDGPDVETAILGPGGVLEGARKGATVVDMSSISPMVSQKVGYCHVARLPHPAPFQTEKAIG
jgi:2-hydroxy-3-oxopropionate reductase